MNSARIIILALLLPASALAGGPVCAAGPAPAPGPVVPVGNVLSVRTGPQDVYLKTEHAQVRLVFYSPSILRVEIGRELPGYDSSYAVIAHPRPTRVHVEQDEGQVVLSTDSLKVYVRKSPFSLQCYTAGGALINEDEEGLSTSWVGTAVTTYKHLQDGERFLGLGEKTGPLDRRGLAYVNWNTDDYAYLDTQDPLYSSIPFYIGLHHGVSYGLFLDNSYETSFNFGASNDRFSSFGARDGILNYYLIWAPSIAGVIRGYTDLTGRMPLPPMWSLGYQQNRYSYYPQAEVLRIAQTLREKNIPSDGVTLDIHFMDAYKLFTWNPDRFPDPGALTAKLRAMGFRLTVIVDPGVKVEKGYPVFESGLAADVFLKYPDGQYYTARVWPGWCHFPDFTLAKGRTWWAGQIGSYIHQGVSGIWNDMNEPSTWGQQVPDNVLFDFDGHPTSMAEGHNVFALEMVRAGYQGATAALGNQRPFLLTRSGFAGLQRYSAIWTGDNRSEDSHMLLGVRILESLGLSGVAFTGMDIGGFSGNPTADLYARWMELGAFLPYDRNHTQYDSRSSEPWTYGETVTDICRRYVSLRYHLLPYLYSGFYEATQDGLPLLRSLAITYSDDPKVFDPVYENQFLCGPSLLVAPVTSEARYVPVHLPRGAWYDLYTDSCFRGPDSILASAPLGQLPVFAHGIIPQESLVQTTATAPSDTLFLHVYSGDTTVAFTYYEDDGESFDYRQGQYYRRVIRYDPGSNSLTLEAPEGSYASHFRHIQVILHGFPARTQVSVNGEARTLSDGTWSFLGLPTDGRWQAGDPALPERECRVQMVTLENSNACTLIRW